ncbi:MAG: hypothetical protein Q8Q03_01025 [bacterium]|nr:hypothetical protein [bacterium]
MPRKLSRNGVKRILKVGVISLVSLTVAGYALFAFHDFILGPSIVIYEPANGSTFTSPRITVVGVVKRIQDISLNGRSITIDEEGNFKETALLAPGYNIFTLIARDKFERSKEYRLEFIYEVN